MDIFNDISIAAIAAIMTLFVIFFSMILVLFFGELLHSYFTCLRSESYEREK